MTGQSVTENQLQRVIKAPFNTSKERFLLHSRGGQVTPIEDATAPIMAGEQIEGAVVIASNIGESLRREQAQEKERDRLEGEVHKASGELGQTRAELRALSAYLINTQEQERRRLARELHDDFGQRAALLSIHSDRALEQFHKNPAAAEDLLQRIREEVSTLNLGIRQVSHRLHPSILEDLGLLAAIRSLIDGLRVEGSEISLNLPDVTPVLGTDAATAVYRVAQEALRNSLRHAPGASIQVSLTVEDDAMQFSVRDDGPGFDLTKVRLGGGLGILSMNERARLVNGSLTLTSRPSDGTIVTVRVPVQTQ